MGCPSVSSSQPVVQMGITRYKTKLNPESGLGLGALCFLNGLDGNSKLNGIRPHKN